MRGRTAIQPAGRAPPAACARRDAATAGAAKGRRPCRRERDVLRGGLGELMVKDARLPRLPEAAFAWACPPRLARTLIERMLGGVADQVTLARQPARSQGGHGQEDRDHRHLRARRRRGGGDTASCAPAAAGADVRRQPGGGRAAHHGGERHRRANVRFKWDGKNVSGALCGDMDVTREVKGAVKPMTHTARGGPWPSPRRTGRSWRGRAFPETRVRLEVEPSPNHGHPSRPSSTRKRRHVRVRARQGRHPAG